MTFLVVIHYLCILLMRQPLRGHGRTPGGPKTKNHQANSTDDLSIQADIQLYS